MQPRCEICRGPISSGMRGGGETSNLRQSHLISGVCRGIVAHPSEHESGRKGGGLANQLTSSNLSQYSSKSALRIRLV